VADYRALEEFRPWAGTAKMARFYNFHCWLVPSFVKKYELT
jgi:hypothetical protein